MAIKNTRIGRHMRSLKGPVTCFVLHHSLCKSCTNAGRDTLIALTKRSTYQNASYNVIQNRKSKKFQGGIDNLSFNSTV